MRFRVWFETDQQYQQLFPWATEEDPPPIEKIKRYKSQDNYVKAMSRGGRDTEMAAERLVSAPVSNWFVGEEEIVEIVPGAMTLPAYTFPGGRTRPEWKVAFVHVKTKENVNPNVKKYDRPRHRLLAYYQGQNPQFDKSQLAYAPIGGLSWVGSYIDMAWVAPDWRGSRPDLNLPSLYGALREFARKRGIVGLEPGDDLTSKSFRASQARYDWQRAQQTLKPPGGNEPPYSPVV